ncbi:MAG TPA: hypothetical protein VFW87_10680 [Pirellulales bacterium]|nr:hypothetical protein [Pirellulales bacterium]
MLSVICFLVSVAAESQVSRRAAMPDGIHLVRAAVVEADEAAPHVRNTLLIKHVYGGDTDLNGQRFSAKSADETGQGNEYIVIPRLRIGDQGIWLIKTTPEGLRTQNYYNYMRWPAIELRSPDWAPPYRAVEAFADAVERVSRIDEPNESATVLKNLVIEDNPYISSWAISRLPEVSQASGEVVDFLNRLVDNVDVPVQGQVELDRVQLSLHGPRWQRSKARRGLFDRWFTAAQREREASLVVSRLDEVAQHPETIGFSQEDLLKFVGVLARNEGFPLSERQRIRFVLMWSVRRYDGDQEPFETTADIVASDLPEQVRLDVAWLFLKEFASNEERRKILWLQLALRLS